MNETISNMFDLHGRVAIITGGAGMLGSRYARTLLHAGASVIIADIDIESATRETEKAVTDVGGEALAVEVDVRSKASVLNMVETILKKYGRIDILVNNAAIDPKFDSHVAEIQTNSFEDYPLELWQKSMDVNLTGAFLCSQAVGKVMVKQGGGVIVNISSTYGLVAPDQRLYKKDDEQVQRLFKPVDYAITKAGIAHLTRYLAGYWGERNIRVNTLTPGGVSNLQEEEFIRKYSFRTPLGRMAEKDELCGALLFLVSDASSYMTGANLVVDGGWTAW